MLRTNVLHRALSLGKANSPSLTAEFPAQEKTKSTSLKIETLSQYIYVTNEGNLGRSIYMLKLAQAESDFGLKSQHDDTSQKTNLKTNPKVKLKLSILVPMQFAPKITVGRRGRLVQELVQ